MTNNRIVVIGTIALALLAGIFLEHVLAAGFGLFSVTQPLTAGLGGTEWTWCSVLGIGSMAAVGFYVWKTPRYNAVLEEVVSELRKVAWPSLEETRAATIAVIVASLIAAVLLGMFDVAWQFLTDKIQNPTL